MGRAVIKFHALDRDHGTDRLVLRFPVCHYSTAYVSKWSISAWPLYGERVGPVPGLYAAVNRHPDQPRLHWASFIKFFGQASLAARRPRDRRRGGPERTA